MDTWPSISVVLPVLDEAGAIDACLASLAAQDYPGDYDVVVADGGSTDGTLARLADWSDRLAVTVIPNPARVQSVGCNLAARAATGELLARADGHTTYAPDYLRRSATALREHGRAVAVGGRQNPVGTTPFGEAAALAMTTPLAAGPGRFRHATEVEEVDTVYLGTFRREDFLALGGYRTLPSGVGEDADLFYRWRMAGRTVLLDPSIHSSYVPRDTVRGWMRQNYRYGIGKAELLWLNGRWPSWRPAGPLLLVLGLAGALLVGLGRRSWTPPAAAAGGWLALIATAVVPRTSGAAPRARFALATALMPLTYGVGLLVGLARGPSSVRALDPDPVVT